MLYPEGHKQRTLIRGSNLKGHKPPFWISVNLSDTFKTQMKQKKHSFCMTISRREKDEAQSIISCMYDSPGEKKLGPNQLFLVWCIWSWLIWFQLKYCRLLLVSAKFRYQILNQLHNILRLFDVLPIFPFTTIKTMSDYYMLYTSCLTSCRTT